MASQPIAIQPGDGRGAYDGGGRTPDGDDGGGGGMLLGSFPPESASYSPRSGSSSPTSPRPRLLGPLSSASSRLRWTPRQNSPWRPGGGGEGGGSHPPFLSVPSSLPAGGLESHREAPTAAPPTEPARAASTAGEIRAPLLRQHSLPASPSASRSEDGQGQPPAPLPPSAAAPPPRSAWSCRTLAHDASFGLILASMEIPCMIGYTQIIFKDAFFAQYMDVLLKLVFFSCMVHQASFMLGSRLPFAIGSVQDAGLIFLSAMSSSIVSSCSEAGGGLKEGVSAEDVLKTVSMHSAEQPPIACLFSESPRTGHRCC